MANEIIDTTETTSISSEDEFEKGILYSSPEYKYQDNCMIEHDWSSSDDDSDNDTDDKEITYHHKETSDEKKIHWQDGVYLPQDVYSQYMTRFERRQACYYHEQLQEVRQQLRNENLILPPIYKDIGYHMEPVNTFHHKVNQFMNQTNSYSFVFKLSRSYPTASQNHLAKMVERIETTLNNLLTSKSINETQYMAMKIDRSTVRMNYLYFVSDTHKEDIPVQPIIVCNNGPTNSISRYLGRLLGLLFNDATHCKKFHKAYNVIHALNFYQKSGQLRPTTLFVSFNIDDLCLKFSHQQVINALENFLNFYISSDHSIQGMKISTILELVRLVLDEQYFFYNYKLYRQTAGCASGSSLTIPLVYIYLYYWQRDLLEELINKNELFIRYQDEAFITWNRSEDELRTILATANSQFPQSMWNITHIGSTIDFRDLHISNQNGVFRTSIYHAHMYNNKQLFTTFPDIIQPPIKQNTWKWLRAAMLKAIRYCSTPDTFHEEMLAIQWELQFYKIPDTVFQEAHNEILEDFGHH
ncbi:unnamed protein product [Rotaria sp. Silwood2]|nr:unnamed protein product [Rotaria sp. Silwood2]CAF4189642.1 unnamed protein product [Rotaria sp. Silwood2]CAF4207873.1 unnamed protein product [Rotaria sp. Silwood2]CAF4526559.1 unnamed protein product [Rotaria sp. Silwood2]